MWNTTSVGYLDRLLHGDDEKSKRKKTKKDTKKSKRE